MKNKTIIGICILILLASIVSATVDINRFNELKDTLYSEGLTGLGEKQGELRTIAYNIIDDEMSSRIQKLDMTKEENTKTLLEYKQDLVRLDILYKDAPKTWSLIKSLLPGDTIISTGMDSKGKNIDGTYQIRTIPESGTTHYLEPNQKLDFTAEVESLEGQMRDVDYCWITEDLQEKFGGSKFTFSRQMSKPENSKPAGLYYILTLKILKDAKVICDPNAAVAAESQWKIQVGGKYDPKARVVKFLPEENILLRYSDESTVFKAIVENENNKITYEWWVDKEQKGFNTPSFFLGKCEKKECEVKIIVKEGSTELANGTNIWKIKTENESLKVPIFPDIPLFPKDEIFLKIKQNGNKVDFEVEITDKFYQYYNVIDRYEWDFDGDLRYDRTTNTKTTTFDYSNFKKDTYTVRVKVPVVLNSAGKREIDAETLKNNPIYTQVHYAQAQEFARNVGKEPEPEAPIILNCNKTRNVPATNCKCEGKVQPQGYCCQGIWKETVTKEQDCTTTITTPAQEPGQPKPPITPPPAGNAQIKELQSLLKKLNPKVQENGLLDANTKALVTEAVNYYANKPGAEALKSITQGGITQQKILQNYAKIKKIVNDYVFLKTL